MSDHTLVDGGRHSSVQRLGLTRTEAAKAIGVSPRSIDTLIADRTSGFPFVKIGTKVVVPVRELADWLAAQAQKKRGAGR